MIEKKIILNIYYNPISVSHIMDGSEVKGHLWNDTDTLL